jgi:hypothetical protein
MNNSLVAMIVRNLDRNITLIPFIPNSCHGSFYFKFLLFPNKTSPWYPTFQILNIVFMYQILNTVVPFAPNSRYCYSFYSKFLSWFLLFQILVISKQNFTMVPYVSDTQYCFLCTKFLILLFHVYQMLNTVPYALNSLFIMIPFISSFCYFQTKFPCGSLCFKFSVLFFPYFKLQLPWKRMHIPPKINLHIWSNHELLECKCLMSCRDSYLLQVIGFLNVTRWSGKGLLFALSARVTPLATYFRTLTFCMLISLAGL